MSVTARWVLVVGFTVILAGGILPVSSPTPQVTAGAPPPIVASLVAPPGVPAAVRRSAT
ncbi:MAG TPA: hypothetical protein VI007_07395 [bacterium]